MHAAILATALAATAALGIGGAAGCSDHSDAATDGTGGRGGTGAPETSSGGAAGQGGTIAQAGAGGASGGHGSAGSDPAALGERVEIASGSDPDVAMDGAGVAHVAYVRNGITYYRSIEYPNGTLSEEQTVGPGADPQIAVDSQNRVHVVMGAVSYARATGSGFSEPSALMAGWRKPRLAVDSADRIYVTVERQATPRIQLVVVQDGVVTVGPLDVGADNNGAIDIDGSDAARMTWRDYFVFYGSYSLAAGVGTAQQLHESSDFSWCAVDLRDDSLHVVNTIRNGLGIHYRALAAETWSDPLAVAVDEVTGVDDPDNVGPTIDVDSAGYKFVALSGRGRVPYRFIVGPDNVAIGVAPLDPEGGSLAGGKFENPNVGAHPARRGALVAWGAGTVYLRGVGIPE